MPSHAPPPARRGFARWLIAAAAVAVPVGCTPAPPLPPQPAAHPAARPDCGVGADAKGIAAGFFAFFQDRPDCF